MILFHIYDESGVAPSSRRLDEAWSTVAVPLSAIRDISGDQIHHCLFEVDVTSLSTALRIRDLVSRIRRRGVRIFACRRGDRHAAIQAGALGATNLVDLPIVDETILRLLLRPDTPVSGTEGGSVVGSVALDLAFRAMERGGPLSSERVEDAALALAEEIEGAGIDPWLRSIRAHHAGTYQHCLIVTGLATAFGRAIGFSKPDLSRLTTAALLHDIGKSRVDQGLLDKPGTLTAQEREIVQNHTVWGADYLAEHSQISADILDAVRHHHEYLDGTGYPDGLRDDQISDLTRLITISDIFGALIEERSYKPAMPADEAYAILVAMAQAGKLERALVDAFTVVAERLKEEGGAGMMAEQALRQA